jgi:hypothetical protein
VNVPVEWIGTALGAATWLFDKITGRASSKKAARRTHDAISHERVVRALGAAGAMIHCQLANGGLSLRSVLERGNLLNPQDAVRSYSENEQRVGWLSGSVFFHQKEIQSVWESVVARLLPIVNRSRVDNAIKAEDWQVFLHVQKEYMNTVIRAYGTTEPEAIRVG